MASSNFVDYVKIFCRSGKGGNGAMHFNRAKYVPKADLTVVTAVKAVMSSCEAMHNYGRCFIFDTPSISLRAMASRAVQTREPEQTATT